MTRDEKIARSSLSYAGCRCKEPRIHWRPDGTPRCQSCGVVAELEAHELHMLCPWINPEAHDGLTEREQARVQLQTSHDVWLKIFLVIDEQGRHSYDVQATPYHGHGGWSYAELSLLDAMERYGLLYSRQQQCIRMVNAELAKHKEQASAES